MSTLPSHIPLSDAYPAYLAVMTDEERTAFLTAHPEIDIAGSTGLARHKSDMLLRAGDLDGAVAILQADSDARWRADYERRCAAQKPSVTGRIMSGLYGACGPFLFGSAGMAIAGAIHAPGLVALASSVATVGAGIGGIIGALTARRGC